MSAETERVPTALTGNAFTRTSYTFTGWNTAASGSGTAYADRAHVSVRREHPYAVPAQWTAVPLGTR